VGPTACAVFSTAHVDALTGAVHVAVCDNSRPMEYHAFAQLLDGFPLASSGASKAPKYDVNRSDRGFDCFARACCKMFLPPCRCDAHSLLRGRQFSFFQTDHLTRNMDVITLGSVQRMNNLLILGHSHSTDHHGQVQLMLGSCRGNSLCFRLCCFSDMHSNV
jgi:hypothetical protein